MLRPLSCEGGSRNALAAALAALLLLLAAPGAFAYSVLTHEAIIDSTWDQQIAHLLRKRFPAATDDQLTEAHAYAYGGCIIQDMGYYPFGSKLFSDLVHYVRSGDFVEELLRESQDVNEYAFALGALAHYAADNHGHQTVNRVVPILYPRLRKRYGEVVTYEDNPTAHLKTEFGFDVLEVAEGHFAPKAYHDFIGFQVSESLLERSFQAVYGLELKDVFLSTGIAKGRPRCEARPICLQPQPCCLPQGVGSQYERPGVGARILAAVFRLIPKVGPFRGISFRAPTPHTTEMFTASFNETLTLYRRLLDEVGKGSLDLKNTNLDVGEHLPPGRYYRADEAHSKLMEKLAAKHSDSIPAGLRKDLATYCQGRNLSACAGLF